MRILGTAVVNIKYFTFS